uniref:AAA+ ATPase domain-containing protein n=1 Tax=Oryza brachyantha TaxID=4533 RepID=J3N036_ORYBR
MGAACRRPAAVQQFDVGGDIKQPISAVEQEPISMLDLDLDQDVDLEEGEEDDELLEQLLLLEGKLDLVDQQQEDARLQICDLHRDLRRAEENLRRLRVTPLVAGQLVEFVDEHRAVVTLSGPHCEQRCVRVLSAFDRELLKPSENVTLHGESLALVGVLPPAAADVTAASSYLVADADRPDVTYDDIGGCEAQKQELREAVELPLTHPELFDAVGVDPPRGVLLHGPPGTGKTMLAKAVAHHTSAAFFRVNGAELAWYNGPAMVRAAMVRALFRLARHRAPAIIFIDEVDAIATARSEGGDAANRLVQRVLMELLIQMDGFDDSTNVRVIMATNRADDLDPALLRPGRVDRKIEFTAPKKKQERRLVLQACVAGMNLDGDVDLDAMAARRDELSPAEIAAVCREAGMQAVRDRRGTGTSEDFDKGYRTVVDTKPGDVASEFHFYN